MTRTRHIIFTLTMLASIILASCDMEFSTEPALTGANADGHAAGSIDLSGLDLNLPDMKYFDQPVWVGIHDTGVQDTVFHADQTCKVLHKFRDRKKYDHYHQYWTYWNGKTNYRFPLPKCMTCSADFGP